MARRDDKGRRLGRQLPSGDHSTRQQGPSQPPSATRILPRCARVLDPLATLAFDVAALARHSNRAPDACAATHLDLAVHQFWCVAEALAESAEAEAVCP